jgi:hypothetical protein
VIVAFKPEAALLRLQALSATSSRDTVEAQAQRRANGLAAARRRRAAIRPPVRRTLDGAEGPGAGQ